MSKHNGYMFAGRKLIGIELPHTMMSYGSCLWCNEPGKKTNVAILCNSYRICKECLSLLELSK